ncbi:hypothetical protein I3760_04G092000 [Carya illinoinensis]|nr:hypothetical protein I3760_04G092000 [Carya illinoinensis]
MTDEFGITVPRAKHLLAISRRPQGEANTNEFVVGSAGTSANGRAGCSKEISECREGNEEPEDNVFVNEDYIYTNSFP